MANTCSVCRHPLKGEIDRELLSFNASLRDIARQFKLENHNCLHRHLSNCLSEEVALARREQAERTITTIQEIAGVLTSVMRGDITDLFDEHGRIDIDDIRARGLGGLVKSVTITQEKPTGLRHPPTLSESKPIAAWRLLRHLARCRLS